MKFILMKNKTITSTLGHTIEFVKGVPTHVPPEMYSIVQEAGAIPESEMETDEPADPSKEPADPVARKAAVMDAFAALVKRAKREEFSGTGVPHTKALISQVGFSIDSKERDVLWAEYKLAVADQGE